MAPCSGKAKCACGCPSRKKKVAKRKAVQKRKPASQRGSAVIQTFPGMIQPQFTPSLLTPIPSAVSKVTGDNIVKRSAEIATQTDVSFLDKKKIKKLLETPVERKPKKERKITEGVLEPVEVSSRGYSVVRRARSVSRPAARATNVPEFIKALEARQGKKVEVKDIQPQTLEPPKPIKVRKPKVVIQDTPVDTVEDIVPIRVEDIQPRSRGRKPDKKALGNNMLPGVQSAIQPALITSLLQAPQN